MRRQIRGPYASENRTPRGFCVFSFPGVRDASTTGIAATPRISKYPYRTIGEGRAEGKKIRMNRKGGRSAADYTEVERSKGSKAGEGSRDRDDFKPPSVGPCRSPCTPGGKSWNMELALWSSREFRRCGSHDRQVRGGAAAAGRRRDLAGRDQPRHPPLGRDHRCVWLIVGLGAG